MPHPLLKKHPLRQAFDELLFADKSYRRMMETCHGDFSDYERTWRVFLSHIERFWTKTQAAVHHLPGWTTIESEVTHLRKTDTLLSYLRHARDADEHSIQELAAEWDAKIIAVQEGQRIHASWQPWDRPLLAVSNRGVAYAPPRMHLGQPLEPLLGTGKPEPIVMAELAMTFYVGLFNRVCDDVVRDTRET